MSQLCVLSVFNWGTASSSSVLCLSLTAATLTCLRLFAVCLICNSFLLLSLLRMLFVYVLYCLVSSTFQLHSLLCVAFCLVETLVFIWVWHHEFSFEIHLKKTVEIIQIWKHICRGYVICYIIKNIIIFFKKIKIRALNKILTPYLTNFLQYTVDRNLEIPQYLHPATEWKNFKKLESNMNLYTRAA